MAEPLMHQRREMTVDRVVTLLTGRHAHGLVERHVRALRRLARDKERGFFIRELEGLTRLLAACGEHVRQNDVYVEPLCDVVKLCGKPFLKVKASDEREHGDAVVTVMAELGGLIDCGHTLIQVCVSHAVVSLFTTTTHQPVDTTLPMSSPNLNVQAIEESHVAQHLASCLLSDMDNRNRLVILDGLLQLSVSGSCCCDMLVSQAAHRVCSCMLDCDPTNRVLSLSVELLWNLIENGSKDQVAEQLGNLECINVLREAFCRQMALGKRSQSDRELRNDILVIAHLVASHCPNAPFVESGFVQLLVLFSTFTEVKSNHDLVRGLNLSQAREDFELKKLLISILVTLSSFPVAVKVMMDGYILLALFSFVKPNDKAGTEWTAAQFEELQLEALAALAAFCPFCVESYMTCQGSTRILLLLEWCTSQQGHFVGLGNGFHGDGGYGNRRSQMRHCLRILLNMTSLGDEMVLGELSDQGAIQQLVQLLQYERGVVDWDSLDEIDLGMRCDIMLILSALCDSDSHRKELFGNDGVASITPCFKMRPHLFKSGRGHHQLMLSAVTCCWSAVVGCALTEAIFLEEEGMFLLLDLLEVCPDNMQNLVLGTILDLCENPKSIPHVLMWKGQNDNTVANLLLRLWRAEEKVLNVQRDEDGLITDVSFPLAGDVQRSVGICSASANQASPAILDVVDNMRAKIYALLHRIVERIGGQVLWLLCAFSVSLVKSFSNISGLCPSDLVTLSVIEQYLELKLGEVWHEINDELTIEQLEPTPPDRDAIEQILESLGKRATTLCSTQLSHIQSDRDNDVLAEQQCYDKMKESCRMEEKAKLDFMDFMKRTSNYKTLRNAREEQKRMIETSRFRPVDHQERKLHQTHQLELQTTTFSGRHVNVESTCIPTQQISPMQA